MRHYLWAATVLGLLVVSVLLFVTSTNDGNYGWFAYTPGDETFASSPGVVIMSRGRVAAWAVGALAMVVLAAGAGYAAGRRQRAAN